MASFLTVPPPNQSDTHPIFQTAESGDATGLATELKSRALSSLYYFNKVVLNFNALSPNFHFDRCQEIQESIPDLKRGFLWPRGHFKSTILKGYVLWRLVGGGWDLVHPDLPPFSFDEPELDPRNQRFLFVGESEERLAAALRNIKWHLTSNGMMKWLFPEVCPRDTAKSIWRDDMITLPRSIDYDECTIRVVGAGTKITGFHGNTFLFDDLIGEKAAASEAEMQKANDWIDYAFGLADNPELVEWLFAGTRWKYGKADTYGRLMEEMPFYRDATDRPHGIKWFVHSAIKDDGTPAFPERFSINTLEDIRKQQKDYKYSCQYLNIPATPEGGDFPSNLVKTFVGDGTRLTPTDGTPPCDLNELLRIAFWDLSSGGKSKGACENAIIAIGTHADGRRFILDAFLKNCGYREALEAYYRLHDQYNFYQTWYEKIGAQKEVEEIHGLVRANGCELCRRRQEASPDTKIPPHRRMRLEGYDHKGFSGNKEDRIRLYMQSTVEEGRLYVNAKLAGLRTQIISFPHYHLKDGTDSCASAVHLSRAPWSPNEQASQDIDREREETEAPEARVHTSRCYGGYA